MLTARYSVILDAGHGPGTSRPLGAVARGRREVDVVRAICEEAAGALAAAGISVRVFADGPYHARQSDPLVATADLYLSVHCDVQPSKRPYALALALPVWLGPARQLAESYAEHAGIGRVEAGEPGSTAWPNGRGLIASVHPAVPAMVLELGSLAHAEHDRLWMDAHGTGGALARAIAEWLGQ